MAMLPSITAITTKIIGITSLLLRFPMLLGARLHSAKRRTCAAMWTAACLAILLLRVEYSSLCVNNDISDWWDHYEIWEPLIYPTQERSGLEDQDTILIPPRLLPSDIGGLTGNFEKDDGLLSKYRKRKQDISTALKDSIYSTRPQYTWRWFFNFDARDLRTAIARRTGAHTLPLPPNYRKPFWRAPMKLLGGDPLGDGDYFSMLYRSRADFWWWKSAKYDAEAWWLYVLMWPLVLYTISRLYRLARQMSKAVHPENLSRLGMISGKVDAWVILIDALIWVAGCTVAWSSLSNIFLSWPQRVLYSLFFATCFLPGVMIYWRLILIGRWHATAFGAKYGPDFRVSRVKQARQDKLILFGIAGLWLTWTMISEQWDVYPGSDTLPTATLLIWFVSLVGFIFLIRSTWDRGDVLSADGLNSWRKRVVGSDFLLIVTIGMLNFSEGPIRLLNWLP